MEQLILDEKMTALISECARRDVHVCVYEQLSSTNDHIREHLDKIPDLGVVIAKRQSAGRGRLEGRSFFSPLGGLYMSMLIHPDKSELPFITIAAAVAVARVIHRLIGVEAQIKWVNDIYVGERKVCGILTEAIFESDNVSVIVGIGVNLVKCDFGELAADGLTDSMTETEYAVFVSEVINEFVQCMHKDADVLVNQYRALDMLKGRVVRVIADREYMAVAEGVDDECHLVVRDVDGAVYTLIGGEVSIRLN